MYAEQYPGSLNESLINTTTGSSPDVTVSDHGCGSLTDKRKFTVNCYSSGGCFFGSFGLTYGFKNKLYAR